MPPWAKDFVVETRLGENNPGEIMAQDPPEMIVIDDEPEDAMVEEAHGRKDTRPKETSPLGPPMRQATNTSGDTGEGRATSASPRASPLRPRTNDKETNDAQGRWTPIPTVIVEEDALDIMGMSVCYPGEGTIGSTPREGFFKCTHGGLAQLEQEF